VRTTAVTPKPVSAEVEVPGRMRLYSSTVAATRYSMTLSIGAREFSGMSMITLNASA
jgi:hypothetical protein